MSDIDGGAEQPPQPGWWKASDGNWYPPQPDTATLPPPPPPAGPGAGYEPAPTNGLATWALVLGILSLLLFWAFGLGAVFGIIAVVLGIKGTKQASKHPARPGNGLAVAGIVTGVIGAIFGLLVGGSIILIAVLGEAAEDEFERIGEELDGGINTDPPDGFCDEDRFFQDPDC